MVERPCLNQRFLDSLFDRTSTLQDVVRPKFSVGDPTLNDHGSQCWEQSHFIVFGTWSVKSPMTQIPSNQKQINRGKKCSVKSTQTTRLRLDEQVLKQLQFLVLVEIVTSANYIQFFSFFSVRLFVGSAWSFGFFISATTANALRLRRISKPDLIHYIIFLS